MKKKEVREVATTSVAFHGLSFSIPSAFFLLHLILSILSACPIFSSVLNCSSLSMFQPLSFVILSLFNFTSCAAQDLRLNLMGGFRDLTAAQYVKLRRSQDSLLAQKIIGKYNICSCRQMSLLDKYPSSMA